MGADKKANTTGAGAHWSPVICVSLRMAASAEAPLAPISLQLTLRTRGGAGMVGEQACQWALTQTRTPCGGGAREVGDPRLLEDGGERGGALDSDLVFPETEKVSEAGKARESRRVNGR